MIRVEGGKEPHLSLDTSVSKPASRARSVRPTKVVSHLAPDDIEELRIAIERSLREGGLHDSADTTIDEALRKALRISCAKARLQRVRAEHVLIDVKQIWTSIPSMLGTRTLDRLSELVSACIDEYYAKGEQSVR